MRKEKESQIEKSIKRFDDKCIFKSFGWPRKRATVL